jgi:hypothetical protein
MLISVISDMIDSFLCLEGDSVIFKGLICSIPDGKSVGSLMILADPAIGEKMPLSVVSLLLFTILHVILSDDGVELLLPLEIFTNIFQFLK